MSHRTLAALLLLALIVAPGCKNAQARKERSPAPVRPDAPLSPTMPPPVPTAPEPPPVSLVDPPKSAPLTSGIVPPMPGPGGPSPRAADVPLAVAEETPIAVVGAVEPPQETDDETDGPPGQERRQERKKKREERREERRNPPTNPMTTPPSNTTPPASTDNLAAVRQLVDAAARRNAEIPDYECRLVKREVVNGKSMPQEELIYRFRQKPLSVYMTVVSEAGRGREVLYVQGQFGNQMHVLTGKGDNVLVGAGFKTELDPDSKMATGKSRYRVYEAGLSRTINGLARALDSAPKSGPPNVKLLSQVQRAEYPYPLDGVEVTLRPGDDPLLPRGGKRLVYFDTKPESPSHKLPVLILTSEPDGREVEYYCFDRFKIPSGMTPGDWTPARLKRK